MSTSSSGRTRMELLGRRRPGEIMRNFRIKRRHTHTATTKLNNVYLYINFVCTPYCSRLDYDIFFFLPENLPLLPISPLPLPPSSPLPLAHPTHSNFAAHFGQLETLRYAVEHNCPLEPQNCALAARGGHLHCLQYLRSPSVDCPWESDTCEYAAMNGHLHCLRWAHENGCEWDYLTTREARRNGHTECLNFAIAHGCDEISDLSDVSDVSSVEYEEDSYESDTSLTNTDTGDG